MLRASDFKTKEVINIKNSEKLGFVSDFEICTTNGEISAIIVPEKGKFFGAKSKGKRIPWCNISSIGEEVILVSKTDDVWFFMF